MEKVFELIILPLLVLTIVAARDSTSSADSITVFPRQLLKMEKNKS